MLLSVYLYVNILPTHIFDTLILSSVSRKVINQLWQTIYKLIETCKSILDTMVKLS